MIVPFHVLSCSAPTHTIVPAAKRRSHHLLFSLPPSLRPPPPFLPSLPLSCRLRPQRRRQPGLAAAPQAAATPGQAIGGSDGSRSRWRSRSCSSVLLAGSSTQRRQSSSAEACSPAGGKEAC